MYLKLLNKLLLISTFTDVLIDQCLAVFGQPRNIYQSLVDNKGMFDFGFTLTYVGSEPFEFEYFVFIGQHLWKLKKNDYNEQEMCIDWLDSEQHKEFNVPFTFAVSYLGDHMVKHDDELNLTNHVILQFTLRSSSYMPEFESHELIEHVFDANHKNLEWLVYGDYYQFPIHHFNATVAFQPQSFTDDEDTDGPNFVFIQQNMTENGYIRRSEVHSIIDEQVVRNTTEKFGKLVPYFIDKVDPRLYINVMLPTRMGPGGVEEGIPAVILLIPYDGVMKYCITEETKLDESCQPENLKQLIACHLHKNKDEL